MPLHYFLAGYYLPWRDQWQCILFLSSKSLGIYLSLLQTEKNLSEHGSKIAESDKKKIEQDLEELKKLKDSEDLEAIKTKTEQLVQSSIKMGEAIYKQNPQNQPPQPDPSGSEPSSGDKNKKDEKIVDADFEEVDDSKNKKD